jgi:hypothetical protein
MKIETKLVNYDDEKQANELLLLLNEYAKDPMGGGSELATFSKSNLIE